MDHQHDPELANRARNAERLDRQGRIIFVVLALFIVVAAGSYFFVPDHVQINPGKNNVDNTSTRTTPVRTADQQ
jgi:hypothetical protein